MKICFASDLHVDFGDRPDIDWPEAEVLIIAGDTANKLEPMLDVMKTASSIYPMIVAVDGNHEHYGNAKAERSVEDTLTLIEQGMPPNVVFLPRSGPAKIGPYYFVGRNGWYSFDSAGDPIINRSLWKEEIRDCARIGFDEIEQMPPWELAREHAEQLHSEISQVISADPEARFVVVTHSAPHRDMVSGETQYLKTNPFYINLHMAPLIEEFASRIVVWHHGHTHHRREKLIHGVYVVANPRGNVHENHSWEPVVIDL